MHKIFIGKPRYARETAPLYDASFEGEIVIRGSPTPFLDACRELARRGVTGEAELWGAGEMHPRMSADIGTAARLTVREDRKNGPAFRRYNAFSRSRENPPEPLT